MVQYIHPRMRAVWGWLYDAPGENLDLFVEYHDPDGKVFAFEERKRVDADATLVIGSIVSVMLDPGFELC